MLRRAVLLGAGHAHLYTLKRTAAFVRRGFELVLVAPEIFWYSGLATGGIPRRIRTHPLAKILVENGPTLCDLL